LVVVVVAAGGLPASSAAASPAAALIAATRRAAAGFDDAGAALRAGYVPSSVSGPVEHWLNEGLLRHGATLDPKHPEGLVYIDTGHGLRLVAAMFMLHHVGQPVPVVPGAIWHHHNWCQGVGGIGIPLPGGPCPPGTTTHVGPEMLHVWMADVAIPVFATNMMPAVVCRLAA
jgi:hypothetical protein